MIESGSHAGGGFPTSTTPLSTPPAGPESPSPTAAAPPSADGSKSGARAGEARFVGPGVLAELLSDADAEGFLTVQLDAPGPGHRGRLGVMVEAAVEQALERRGACPPGVAAATDLALSLADQLYRARLVELRGIALGLGTLGGMADIEHTLDTEDSAVLRYLLTAAALHPLRIYLNAADRGLRVFTVPVALHDLMPGSAPSSIVCLETAQPPSVAPAVARSAAAMEQSQQPPAVRENALEALEGDDELEIATVVPPHVQVAEARAASEVLEALTPPPSSESGIDLSPPDLAAFSTPPPVVARALPPAPAEDEAPFEPSPIPPEPFERGPLYASAENDWRTWADELSTARGPKPLSVIERMFVSAYVPLADAVARGIGDASAKQVLTTWATSFEQSYREAFAALRVRGKRPSMVLDIPEIALRIGRLHGARRVELIAVDGMRFDLGLRVEQRVRWRMAQEVALTERLLLWSALPSTTDVQLELLGRGPEALKTWTGEVSSEIPVARGQNARTPRRVKVGHRDLLKLDLVEARLMEPGDHEAARLDDLADELAEVLSAQLARLPARTLAIVFGDHGFKLDPMESGTTSAKSGGASPEEVLVPAFAWLVGGVH
ncbi:MAG TPA: hypothetical protein VHP33_06280 [Polyangiaceae bacterium]|nr:hypothetical protein [Polyangiaceae bacterium]